MSAYYYRTQVDFHLLFSSTRPPIELLADWLEGLRERMEGHLQHEKIKYDPSKIETVIRPFPRGIRENTRVGFDLAADRTGIEIDVLISFDHCSLPTAH